MSTYIFLEIKRYIFGNRLKKRPHFFNEIDKKPHFKAEFEEIRQHQIYDGKKVSKMYVFWHEKRYHLNKFRVAQYFLVRVSIAK